MQKNNFKFEYIHDIALKITNDLLKKILLNESFSIWNNLYIHWINKYIDINYMPVEFENNQLITGGCCKDSITVYINKNDIFELLSNKIKKDDYLEREIYLFFIHELTHLFQLNIYPETNRINSKKYDNNPGEDYREIEAVKNEIVGLNLYLKDNKSIYDCYRIICKDRNVNKKKVLKKVLKESLNEKI